MRSCDYEAVIKDGACYCSEHFTEEELEDPEIFPIFADSAWDYYPACDQCQEIHTYVNLTPDGVHNELGFLQDRYEKLADTYSHPNPFNPPDNDSTQSCQDLHKILSSLPITEHTQLETALEQFPKLLKALDYFQEVYHAS